jgi:hypothetical protein
MSADAPEDAIANQEVSRTTIVYSVLHPTALDPSVMSDVDVANHMASGEFIGTRTSVETAPVPAADVDAEVEALGGIRGFFAEGPRPFGS